MSLFKFKDVAVIKHSNQAGKDKTPAPYNTLTASIAKETAKQDIGESWINYDYDDDDGSSLGCFPTD